MANLAILGHATRGNEVIEILEMLGGVNKHHRMGNIPSWCYYIGHLTYIYGHNVILNEYLVFTLEEFLEKFPYKVEDKAFAFGNKCTIIDAVWDESIDEVVYTIKLDTSKYTTTKLSNQLQPYKEETMEIPEKLKPVIDLTEYSKDEYIIKLGNYEIKEVNGVVKAVRKRPQYTKTYEECCEVLGCKANHFFTNFSYNGCDVEISEYEDKVDDLLQNFRKLIYCRNAYWKIAGDWRPNVEDEKQDKYAINNVGGKLSPEYYGSYNSILCFPTREIRDIFYENFKDLIEQCKDLL